MLVNIGQFKIEVAFQEGGSYTSEFTGKNLRTGKINFVLRSEEEYNKMTSEIASIQYLYGDENETITWEKGLNSSSFTAGQNIYRFNIDVKEVENLELEKIIINGVSFSPCSYEKRISNEALIIDARINEDKAVIQKLRDLMKDNSVYQVSLVGILENEISMRFGSAYDWSHDLNNNTIQQSFCLVETIYDQNVKDHNPFLHKQTMQLINTVNIQKGVIDYLTKKLIQNNILTEDEIKNEKEELKDKVFYDMFDFYENKPI